MNMRYLPGALQKKDSFSRQEYVAEMKNEYDLTDDQISYDLRRRLKTGEIVRQGWGQYAEASEKQMYHFQYSDLSNEIAGILSEEFYDPEFRIFEFVQLNDFMNHLVGRNTIFFRLKMN